MGSFYTPDKGGAFWALVSYLADKNVWIKDRTLLPFTPSRQQIYTALYPDQYSGNPYYPTVLSVWINNVLAGYGFVNTPDGLFYVPLNVPKDNFKLEVRDELGTTVLTTEFWNAKNYAMFLGVAAQSLEERRADLELVKADQRFQKIRTGRLFAVLGEFFDFPPPPGWTDAQYRAAILGDNDGCPGFVKSFFKGSLRKGVVDTIKSITCDDVEVLRAKDVFTWVLYDDANAPSPTDAGALAWFITDDANLSFPFVYPNQQAVLLDNAFFQKGVVLQVGGSERTVTDEDVFKSTNSFIEAPIVEPFDLAGKTLDLSVEVLDVPGSLVNYSTTFPLPTTTAAGAAAEMLLQNPGLTSAVYGTLDGHLRIGIPPVAGQTQRLTIVGGSACADLGLVPGTTMDIHPDVLANPWVVSGMALVYGAFTYTQGVEFDLDATRGQIVWKASSLANPNVPPAGAIFKASYTYQMRREIEKMAELAKSVDSAIVFQYT